MIASLSHGVRSCGRARVVRQQLDRRVNANLAERLLDLHVRGAVELGLQRVDVDLRRLQLSHQHHVVALAVVRVAPDDAVRKRLAGTSPISLFTAAGLLS